MSERRVDGFFYGLFMDREILLANGVSPANPRRAFIDGFQLRIGQRATLVAQEGTRAYGMVFALTHTDLEKLYTAPGLEVYRPEAVLTQLVTGETLPALCYNLIKPPGPAEGNTDYAVQLRDVLRQMEFPSQYIDDIQ